MAVAFIFPGQGSQFVGMGQDLYAEYPLARERYQQANEVLGFDLQEISFSGPEDRLKQTAVTQPAIFVHSIIVYELLRQQGISPAMVAGHSLGEYSALVASGAFSFRTGLQLVKLRGQLMQNAGTIQPGTMAAIIGLAPEAVDKLCRQASADGVVVPANYNSPEQIVISGSLTDVRRAVELAKKAGARRAIELEVSGAFHSPLMATATAEMSAALQNCEILTPVCPIVANVTAKPTRSVTELRAHLLAQLTQPVRWVESIRIMVEQGMNRFCEIGPGKVLTGLLRRIDSTVECTAIGSTADLAQIQVTSADDKQS